MSAARTEVGESLMLVLSPPLVFLSQPVIFICYWANFLLAIGLRDLEGDPASCDFFSLTMYLLSLVADGCAA